MDASNILKPSLARGELQCIGATTLDDYRKYVERDPALERRLQPVSAGSLIQKGDTFSTGCRQTSIKRVGVADG